MSDWRYALFVAAILICALVPVHNSATSKEDEYLQRSLEYIEKERKSDVLLKLIDADLGKPISGKLVKYRQISHDFVFATGHGWVDDAEADIRSHLGAEYLSVWSWPFYWADIEPEEGKFDFTKADNIILGRPYWWRGLRGYKYWANFSVLPHTYSAGLPETTIPAWVKWDELHDPDVFDEYLTQVYRFVHTVVDRYKETIKFWSTENEINAPEHAPRLPSGKPPWTIDQAVEIVRTMSQAIRDADPDATVILLTSSRNARVDPLDFAQLCVERGVDFDSVGFEAYPNDPQPTGMSLADIYEYMAKFTKLGKTIFMPEVVYWSADPIVHQLYPGPYWQKAEAWGFSQEAQAEWLRYILIYTYGMPSTGFNWFVFSDQATVENRDFDIPYYNLEMYGGLLDADGKPKQAFHTFRELINNWTTSGEMITDDKGCISFRGFAGDYDIDVEGYESVKIHVSEGVPQTFTLNLRSCWKIYLPIVLKNYGP